MAMPTVFKSSEEFYEFTYSVSQQLKSMKLATLRQAIAKAAGFRDLNAYIKDLDKGQNFDVPPQKVPSVTDWMDSVREQQDKLLADLGVAICVDDDMIMFQGQTFVNGRELSVENTFNNQTGNVRQTKISAYLTGNDGALEHAAVLTDAEGNRLVRGYLDVTEKPREALAAIRYFRATQGNEWYGEKLFTALYNAIMNAMFETPDWWSDYGMLELAKGLCGGMPLHTVSRMMGEGGFIATERRWMDWVPRTMHPDQLESLSSAYCREGTALHDYVLHVQVKNMILTVFNYVKADGVDGRDLDAVKVSILNGERRLEDFMALSFFNELPVEVWK